MEELRDFIFSTNYWHCKNNVGDKLDNKDTKKNTNSGIPELSPQRRI